MATRTLPELELVYTNPHPVIEAALLATTTPDKFNLRGAQIDSLRVLTDVRRLFPIAIQLWEDADPAQRKLLRGVGPGVFAVCVAQWASLEAMWASQEGSVTGDRGVRQVRTVTLADAHRGAMFARALAVAALGTLAGADAQRRLALDVATGRADTDESLAQGLVSLGGLGRAWACDPALAALASDSGIDAEWAEDLEGVAQILRAAMEDTRRMTAQVSQARLDYQDGVVLHLLGKLIKIYAAANNIDRRIVRLVPTSTMGMFHRKRTNGAAETDGDDATESVDPVVEPAEVPIEPAAPPPEPVPVDAV